MKSEPVLPIKFVYRTWDGPLWRKRYFWEVDEYSEWASFFADVEDIDTFGDEHTWVEDTTGAKWDVRTHQYLWGDPSETVFALKPAL